MTAPAEVAADALVRSARVYRFDRRGSIAEALAIRDGRILATGMGRASLDHLVGAQTRVIEGPNLVVMPGFCDTHVHQYEGGLELQRMPMDGVRSIDDILKRVKEWVQQAVPNQWIVSTRGWHESNLAERRLPTSGELDRVSTLHPICLRRGSHAMVVNTRALRLASLGDDGTSNGQLVGDAAIKPILDLLPEPTDDQRVVGLEEVGKLYNSRGIVAIRDPGIASDDLRVYQEALRRGALTTRSRVMVRLNEGWPMDRILAEIERWPVGSGLGDDLLRLDGMKFFVDGRIADAALRENLEEGGSKAGRLYFDTDTLTVGIAAAVRRGWDIGCHACGDVAVEMVINAYQRVLESVPEARARRLMIEHAFFCDRRQRERARSLGVRLSIHPALLYAFGAEMLEHWGDRADDVMPIRDLVDEGVRLAAGSDGNVPPFDPMLGIWTLITRRTANNRVVGRRHAIDRLTAFRLYTVAGAELLDEQSRRGSIQPGLYADLVAYHEDPLRCDVDKLPELQPAWTIVGGKPVFDPEGCWKS
jgi:predicted amidohydrolase YtcJ